MLIPTMMEERLPSYNPVAFSMQRKMRLRRVGPSVEGQSLDKTRPSDVSGAITESTKTRESHLD